jgi:hypothetical protein
LKGGVGIAVNDIEGRILRFWLRKPSVGEVVILFGVGVGMRDGRRKVMMSEGELIIMWGAQFDACEMKWGVHIVFEALRFDNLKW